MDLSSWEKWDFITDIHGQYEKLIELLSFLGYRRVDGVWQHSERKAFFLGDLIDRGPRQRDVINLVRDMCNHGHAKCIMGNHEYNAVCWTIAWPDAPKQFLYQHSERNLSMHGAFLSEYEGDEDGYNKDIEWFKSLPIAYEGKGFRAIHACWHKDYITMAGCWLNDDFSIPDFAWLLTKDKSHALYLVVETLMKGPEIVVPEKYAYKEKSGRVRDELRIAWWQTPTENLPDILVTAKAHQESLPEVSIIEAANRYVYKDEKPVFFGHYWFTGQPSVINGKMACLDYSAGAGGDLVSYRWDGEQDLSSEKIVKI